MEFADRFEKIRRRKLLLDITSSAIKVYENVGPEKQYYY
jgi:hypothetical protein